MFLKLYIKIKNIFKRFKKVKKVQEIIEPIGEQVVDLEERFDMIFDHNSYFVCNKLEVKKNIITFKGYYISGYNGKYYQGYSNSSIDYVMDKFEEEELKRVDPSEITEKYREFEKRSKKSLEHLTTGSQFGDFLFKKKASNWLNVEAIEKLILMVENEEFNLSTHELTITSFTDKEYAVVQYYKKTA